MHSTPNIRRTGIPASKKGKPTYGGVALTERFRSKIEVNKETGCWEWTAVKNKDGYGEFQVCLGKKSSAHRLSYEAHYGPIAEGMNVLHRCDNPCCVNPIHLFLGTQAQNMEDRNEKGRQARGQANGGAKLTERDVLDIRSSVMKRYELAIKFGVSKTQITNIRAGRNWAHLKGAAQ